jgi:RNA polymerase sigma-70 factor (ECF subfamily)
VSGTPEDVNDEILDDAMPTPQQMVSGAELGELIARHVSNLPPRQREVLVLVAYEQMLPSQAAAVLGISEESARTNLHHARNTLKRLLAAYLEDDSKGFCETRRRSTI